MPIYNVDDLTLFPIETVELSLPDILDSLLKGDVLVVQSFEKTRHKDVLIKMENRKYPLTFVSFDLDPFSPRERYWQLYDLTLNALALHSVYKYDEYTYSLEFTYQPGKVVRVHNLQNRVYIIDGVYVTPEKEAYYTLEGLDGYYTEDELTPYEYWG